MTSRVASTVDPATDAIGWGIWATGRIAGSFATDLAVVPGHRLAAVASRTAAHAQAFAAEHGAERSHDSLDALVADPAVDVVYVATPHSRHAADVTACLEAGKHVLVEKPMAMDAAEAEPLVALARAKGLFLAEAMWMRANPAIRAAVDVAATGGLGTVTALRADLGFVGAADKARLWDPALGASALLDVGVYPLTLAHLVLGEPDRVLATGVLSDRGFDLAGGAVLTYSSGAVATLSWGQTAKSDSRASFAGDLGLIELPHRFHHPDFFTLVRDDSTERVDLPRTGKGMTHEIVEVGACLAAGRTESDVLPLDPTLAVLRLLDEIGTQLRAR